MIIIKNNYITFLCPKIMSEILIKKINYLIIIEDHNMNK